MANDAERKQKIKELELQMARVNLMASKLKTASLNPELLRIQREILARRVKPKKAAIAKKPLKPFRVKRIRI